MKNSAIRNKTNPFSLFHSWFREAGRTSVKEPNAMTLATADADGKPSARMVLLKDYGEAGFIFFTNYESRKGRELTLNPFAGLVFWWEVLQKQIRIEGKIGRLSAEESDHYFRSRPRGSQIGAWASRQSSILESYNQLRQQYAQAESAFSGKEVSRPAYWGGFRLIPDRFEFWQAGPNRLHHRQQFVREKENQWRIEVLSP
jgi:pyridoxamine 5'-phosphate oxidase